MDNNNNNQIEDLSTQTTPNNDAWQTVRVSVITAIITTLLTGYAFIHLSERSPRLGARSNNQIVEVNSQSENAVVNAVEKANPAVVAITVSKNVPVYERYYENTPSPFGGFFNFQTPQLRQNGTELQEIGGGSGFLVSQDGYIVTNRHVVDDETAQYTVFTNDGKKFDAQVVDRDPMLDLAVIKIEGGGFTSLSFGDSDQVKVGQTAIAIGNALGEFRNTVSTGIISGLARSITASDNMGSREILDKLIQTDASINSGNSGGPLLNLSGEVIGVNVAVAQNANGIGFALSSNSVKNVVESVKKTGKIVRPYLGIRYTQITPAMQKRNNLPVDYGVLIAGGQNPEELAVIPGSPADKAGIQPNDIILEADGKKIDESTNLQSLIASKNISDKITLKILSRGSEKSITVTLEEAK